MNLQAFISAALLSACATTQNLEPPPSVSSHDGKASSPCTFSQPVFPKEMISNSNINSARVTVRAEIMTSGDVGAVVVKKSSGFELLDRAAVNAVRGTKCKFTPPLSAPIWAEQWYEFNVK